MSDRQRSVVRAPDFPVGLEWLNVDRPLSLKDLRGKLVILDFWTFCCINCQHVLPQLRQLEERFPEELVVIGVHCGKFHAEAETYNVRQAVMRHDVRHPVVNDPKYLLWRAYTVRAWPTIVLIDPEGRVLGSMSGEFDANAIGSLLEQIIADCDKKGLLNRSPLELTLERRKLIETTLRYPGKVLADPAGRRLFVTDTDHHRIVVFGLDNGRVRHVFGSGEPGLTDGTAARARFHSPQGMALRGDSLYVADTENHAIRRLSLDGRTVQTVAGTGEQSTPLPEAGPARATRLNSPWDLEWVGDTLYVAMAGSHQVWAYHPQGGVISHVAGDGREALKDGPRLNARLAQPSGLAWDGERLWIADSETSSLRTVGLEEGGEVRTWIGQGLFEFGDVDGDRATARLQHVLDVAAGNGRIYVADAYNNRLKVLDPRTGQIRTLSGSGEPGFEDGFAGEACFWEPGGISFAGDRLYVADTNNHVIRSVELPSGRVETLDLRD